MTDAKLIVPGPAYLQSYLKACREFRDSGVQQLNMHNPDAFADWKDTIFAQYANERIGKGLPEGYVPASTFWLVEGGTFLGTGNIRHRLTPALERFGGHIGYAIRPSGWNMGYGTLQLRLLLAEARAMGIERALLTCFDTNIGSWRVMEKNGGVHQDTIETVFDGEPRLTRRYWIDTAPRA